MFQRLQEIRSRKNQIRIELEGNNELDLDTINAELDSLNAEEQTITRRMQMAADLQQGEVVADEVIKVVEGQVETEKRNGKMSPAVRSFLRYMMTAGKETRGVTLVNGQAVVPDELDNEIITEMREVSDVIDFINLKNVRGNLRVGSLTPIEANKDKDGEPIKENGGVTGEVTFGSYRVSAKIELGVGLDAESLEAFKEIVVSELALALALISEGQIMTGTGNNEAEGLFTIELPTTQKMSVAIADFGHKVLAELKGKIRRAYGKRASYVVNTETFHNIIEGMVDSTGRPIYDSNTELLLKRPVIISDEAPKGKILFGYGKRYWYNYNVAPTIASSEHEKFSDGLIVHRALAFGDGHVMDKKAFAILEINTTTQTSPTTPPVQENVEG